MSNETIAEGKKRTVAYRCTSCGSIVIMKMEECPHCFQKTLKQIDTQPILTHDDASWGPDHPMPRGWDDDD